MGCFLVQHELLFEQCLLLPMDSHTACVGLEKELGTCSMTLIYSKPTLCLRVRRIIQLGKHDFEGLDCFIVTPCRMQRSVFQLVSKIRRKAKLDGLSTVNMLIEN